MNFSRRGFLRIGMALGAAKALRMPALVPQAPGESLFLEVSSSSCGIEWVHENAMSDNRYLPETLGPGCAFLDFDNDGWMDIYLVNSGPCDFWTPAKPLRNALYKNNRDGTFTDVTEKAGMAGGTFGMGVAVGDYDNDGWPDIFVTSYGRCILYKNNRNGTFTDVTEKAGLAAPGWTTSAVWFDFDNDGLLDLFVCSFVDYGAKQKLACGDNQIGNHYYCIPRVFRGTSSFLYHDNGQPRSGMGVDAGDLDNDGWQDLFVANVDQEMFSLYHNNKNETFNDIAHSHGVAQATRLLSGWGLKYFDYDNDGAVDLILANGHPDDMIGRYSRQVRYKEPLLLFHQGPDGKLKNVSTEGGTAFEKSFAARGLAVGDYDNDGALDVLVATNGGAPVLLKNNAAKGNNWLGLRLEGATCNRDAIGARILWKAGGKLRQSLKNNGGSYLSSHDLREVLGIGAAAQLDELEIHWPAPSKRVDKFTSVAPNRYIHIIEGKGIV